MENKSKKNITIGDEVLIIKKPYEELNYYTGNVYQILTKCKNHPRGTKVKIKCTDGSKVVGRVVFSLS